MFYNIRSRRRESRTWRRDFRWPTGIWTRPRVKHQGLANVSRKCQVIDWQCQCDQIGRFNTVLGNKTSSKSNPNIFKFLGYFKVGILLFKKKMFWLLLGNYWKMWFTFNSSIWSHWITWSYKEYTLECANFSKSLLFESYLMVVIVLSLLDRRLLAAVVDDGVQSGPVRQRRRQGRSGT